MMLHERKKYSLSPFNYYARIVAGLTENPMSMSLDTFSGKLCCLPYWVRYIRYIHMYTIQVMSCTCTYRLSATTNGGMRTSINHSYMYTSTIQHSNQNVWLAIETSKHYMYMYIPSCPSYPVWVASTEILECQVYRLSPLSGSYCLQHPASLKPSPPHYHLPNHPLLLHLLSPLLFSPLHHLHSLPNLLWIVYIYMNYLIDVPVLSTCKSFVVK